MAPGGDWALAPWCMSVTVTVAVVVTVVVSFAAPAIASWAARWLHMAAAGYAPARRAPSDTVSPTSRWGAHWDDRPWAQRALWAVALASYPLTGLYIPIIDDSQGSCRVAAADDGHEPVVLTGSQVVLATAEGENLVLDCLVPSDSAAAEPRLSVPFTLRAVLPVGGGKEIPPELRLWLDTGETVEIVVTRRGCAAVARISGPGTMVTLQLQAVDHTDDPGRER